MNFFSQIFRVPYYVNTSRCFYDPGNVLNRIVQIFLSLSLSVRRKTREKLEPTLFPINYRCFERIFRFMFVVSSGANDQIDLFEYQSNFEIGNLI